ncbi:unnamed protein product, partial [Prorocentrum cordatum]
LLSDLLGDDAEEVNAAAKLPIAPAKVSLSSAAGIREITGMLRVPPPHSQGHSRGQGNAPAGQMLSRGRQRRPFGAGGFGHPLHLRVRGPTAWAGEVHGPGSDRLRQSEGLVHGQHKGGNSASPM